MDKTTTELELKISGGRIVSANVLDNGICKLTIETTVAEDVLKDIKDNFVLIEASKLSLDDDFMKYDPDWEEKGFKNMLCETIKSGVKDFYRPVLDPSFNDDGTGICYEFGKKPAVGKSYNWWEKAAKKFDSSCRLGTRYEYVAFLGVLIKKLVENGWSLSNAWKAVCKDSKALGHYSNSWNKKNAYEDTGSREVCGFFDLANTFKILSEDDKTGVLFWLAGGGYYGHSDNYPLAGLRYDFYRDCDRNDSVGWLVFDATEIK